MQTVAQSWTPGVPPIGAIGHWVALAGLLGVGVLTARKWPGSALAARAERLAGRRGLTILTVGLLSLAFSVATRMLLFDDPFPRPTTHDEFSYLLEGDTFARGRLSNPTHAMADHFETIHVLQWPTYASKYPPGQGAALAVGKFVAGLPIVGVWLSTALACAAVCWMLYAWVPPAWALLGGLLMVLHPSVIGWTFGYWGGALPLVGAALVIGGFRRIVDGAGVGAAVATGVGLAVLANTRPFEGVMLSLPIAIALLVWMVRRERAPVKRVVVPATAVLAVAAAFMLYYNVRVTGHALRTPYGEHDRQYNVTPHFVFQPMGNAKSYPNPTLQRFHGEHEPRQWRDQQTPGGWAKAAGRKLAGVAGMLLQPLALVLPLMMLPMAVRRDRWLGLLVAVIALSTSGLLLVTWDFWHHYAAPMLAAWAVIVAACLARLAEFSAAGRRLGHMAVAAVIIFAVIGASLRVTQARGLTAVNVGLMRDALVEELVGPGGEANELVIMRYLPGHEVHHEWVYNDADIDRSGVVWARDLGDEKNGALLRYFSGRRKWLVEFPAPPEEMLHGRFWRKPRRLP